jgi:extradiol dioxygenase family protein
MSGLRPFHLAIPVREIANTRKFYVETLGCSVGRASETWIDFNFFGHQLSAHLKPDELTQVSTSPVDGENVPVRHFGIVMEWEDWQELSKRLEDRAVEFLIRPTIRFRGQAGEQATMFVQDPSGNALEFKAFKTPDQLFSVAPVNK